MAQDKKRDNIFRFAPSPSGYLHVGGARTAIFNWLLAQKRGGKFLLRLEDTDYERSTEESIMQIFNSLQWLGLHWDEEPVYQSKRKQRHLDIIQLLLDRGKAYRCFCTRTESTGRRMSRYSGVCRNLNSLEIAHNLATGKPFSVRIKITDGITTYRDLIHGQITIDNKEIDDFIIMRSDHTPVYNLAVTVDDHDMGVTHVIRGDDHIANTPKQIQLYQALTWPVPQFGHLPLILGRDRTRLSKRHGAASIEEFQKQGILPAALFNFLCLLGWSRGDDREIFSRHALVRHFSLARISSANAVFDPDKLLWMNGKYLSRVPADKLLSLIDAPWDKPVDLYDRRLIYLCDLVKERAQTLIEFREGIRFFDEDPLGYEEAGIKKYFTKEETLKLLRGLAVNLAHHEPFSVQSLESLLRTYASEHDVSAGEIIHPLRLALTGKTASPGIFDVMYVLGKKKVLRRIEIAISYIETKIAITEEENP
jgi:glutamyl-tRNA synthetase